jgi:hypothetical protein
MTIIDTATVSAFLVVLAVAVIATAITLGVALRAYYASRPARTPRMRAAVALQTRYAH